jgi:hypothetical protein
MNHNSSSILYFPSIEFNDDAWVKSAALIWDHVYRIVPRGYSPKDSDEVKYAIDNDFVRDVNVNNQERTLTLNEFNAFTQSLELLPHGLTSDGETSYLYQDKVDERLYPKLAQEARHVFADGKLELPAGLARGYMLFLAKAVAERRGLALATDDADSWTVFSYFSEDGRFDEQTTDSTGSLQYGYLAMERLVPKNIGNIPMKDLMSFAKEKQSEKLSFRTSLQSFTERLQAVEDTQQRKQELADFCQDLEQQTDRLREVTRSFLSLEELANYFVRGLPMTFSIYSLYKADPFDLTRISTSILMGAVATIAQNKVLNNKPSVSPPSYLLDIQRRAEKLQRFPAFHRAFEEFMND